ncbi:hypothetical protein L211DRAFT_834917 [Terfezia boudieri ATCC MYA-4762]|uniref:Uncharacterized protein n=1 Tax=Terfezia boudieri ATCC MYA-4762 TaxID=1051890 RepID=A0A3N4M1G3_9PEZI|nr:hypothetical protein L211DRAFT_834917 [Terfezia boudieri ATCC MYA-4762]
MGSPQPPLVMPQTVFTPAAASSFRALPLDVKYTLLQQIDSFATLHSLEKALGAEVEDVVQGFRRGVYSAVAKIEFAPVADAVLAMRMLDIAVATTMTETIETEVENTATHKTDKSNTVPKLVLQLTSAVDTGAGLLDTPLTKDKLHTLNVAALGLAELYATNKERTLSTTELFRFKQAVFRCATLLELYKESKAVKASGTPVSPQAANDEDDEEDEEPQDEEVDDEELKEKNKYRPRNTFLATLPHQDVLEMDCVREFMHGLAEGIAKLVEDDEDEKEEEATTVCQDQLASILGEFGFGVDFTKASCSCSPSNTSTNGDNNDSNDRNGSDTNTDNANTTFTLCTLQTPHLADSLLLLGPIALFRLHTISQARPQQTQLLKAIIHALVPNPNRKRDIFWDEVMPFWCNLRSVYDASEGDSEEVKMMKEMKMPKGCRSIMDVMGVRNYEFAVFGERLFF